MLEQAEKIRKISQRSNIERECIHSLVPLATVESVELICQLRIPFELAHSVLRKEV